jgi:hypothetical protein
MTEPSSKEWSERRQLDELLRRRRTLDVQIQPPSRNRSDPILSYLSLPATWVWK